MAAELANAGSIVKYVQLADTDGRGEPGTGSLDWPATLATLRASGYDGPIGLEYYPTDRVERVGEAHPAARGRRMSTPALPGSRRRRDRRQRPGRCHLRPHPERAGAGRDDRDVRGRPDRVEPAGRAREEHRRSRRARPRADCVRRDPHAQDERAIARAASSRPASAALGRARSCSRAATRSRAKTACPSPRCRATSAAWRRTGPARARGRTTASASASSTPTASFDELLDRGASGCSA